MDILDSLEREATEGPDGMAREEVLAIIVDTLEQHPDLEFAD